MTVHVRPPVDGPTIPLQLAGVVAAEFCRTPSRAEVAAVFERSFYLRGDDQFVCVGEPSIGNGPLTLIADVRLAALGLYPGKRAIIAERGIAIGAMMFTHRDCETWRPPRWPQAASSNALAQARETIAHRAATQAPSEGFGRALARSNERRDAFARIARQRLAGLEEWLAMGTAAADILPAPVRDLVGLGPGLTPSGDDVLIGALALLDALARRDARARLASALDRVPPGLTSPLSHCFLRTAAAGHIGEHLHAAISSFIFGDADAAIAAARRIGHSSGWDMLAGAVTALSTVLEARPAHAALLGR